MPDDQVKNALAELQDDVRCRCHPAYKDRGLHDPDCNCDSAGAVQVVTGRIEELEVRLAEAKRHLGMQVLYTDQQQSRAQAAEAKLQDMALDCLAAQGQAAEAYQAQLAALEALELADAALSGANINMRVMERKVKAAIAKLKGEKDEQ